ncbi:DoxX family protein [Streptomyces zingiberis]|uniref:DoxX family protein n=1 Tax=Streptomyces zingiberis TaxID=2053010 RepID=A0ABX1BZ24_9ACTN|nr:DoxX family protein [Streptomyces zingiberis]
METSRRSAALDRNRPYVLSLFRAVVGLLFACQGAASVFGLLGRDPETVGAWPLWYAGVIELVVGVLVLLGSATRSAAFLGAGAMAFAYFTVHQPQGLFPMQNDGEGAALYCWALLLLVFSGPGPWSLDGLLGRGDQRSHPAPERLPRQPSPPGPRAASGATRPDRAGRGSGRRRSRRGGP